MYLAVFVASAILSPVRDIPSATSVHVHYWLEAILDIALIPSAVWMYRTLPPHGARSEAKLPARR